MLLIIRIIKLYNWYAPCYLYKLQQSHLWMEYVYKKELDVVLCNMVK